VGMKLLIEAHSGPFTFRPPNPESARRSAHKPDSLSLTSNEPDSSARARHVFRIIFPAEEQNLQLRVICLVTHLDTRHSEWGRIGLLHFVRCL
jgi:hypothetical protein